MHKKFEINRTKINGGCQSGRKVVTHDSKSDLPLIANTKITPFKKLKGHTPRHFVGIFRCHFQFRNFCSDSVFFSQDYLLIVGGFTLSKRGLIFDTSQSSDFDDFDAFDDFDDSMSNNTEDSDKEFYDFDDFND